MRVVGTAGSVWRYAVVPSWFSRTPGRVAGPAPRLGEHTAEIVDGESA